MSTIRVLLVEDTETEAAQARSMVCDAEETAFEVTWVATSDAALAALDAGDFDVALVDASLGTGERVRPAAPDPRASIRAAARAARRVPRRRARRRGIPPGRRRFPGQGRDHGASPAASIAARGRAQPHGGRAACEPGEPRAGRAHRQPGTPRGRRRPRLQQSPDRHPVGYTTALERHVEPDHPSRESVDAIRRSAELASRLTRQLLAYSRKQTLERGTARSRGSSRASRRSFAA